MLHRLLVWNPLLLCLLLCLLLPACSSYAPPDALPGMSRDEVIARMGQPDLERKQDSGSRLEFPRGPYGRHTWFVYFDATGKASRTEQVLTEPNFNRVEAGMTREQVSQLLGRPSEVWLLGRARGYVWNYRYDADCKWFQVELSLQQEVRSAGYGTPPECDRGGDRIGN